MLVTNNTNISKNSNIKNTKKSSQNSNIFESILESASNQNGVSETIMKAIQANNNINMIDIANYEEEKKSKKYCDEMLEQLKEIRNGLINNGINLEKIDAINQFMNNNIHTTNPDLYDIINQTKLRIAVEIAKINCIKNNY
jgi:hypothetical protein